MSFGRRGRSGIVVKLALFGGCLIVCGGVAGQDKPDLESLYRSHRWFDLRDALQHTDSSPFYRGVVACAFNGEEQCRREIHSVIQSVPTSEQAYLAHEALGYLYFRTGRYRPALAEIEAQLALKPGKPDLLSGRSLLTALSQKPELAVERRRASRLRYEIRDGGMFIPVSINGRLAHYFVDTGLNVSLMSESEAKRLGLTIHEIASNATKLYGNAGGQIAFRVAVADHLTVGRFRLRHVVFLVVSDKQEPFPELSSGRRGGIGLPVLLAFERIRWGADGTFEIAAATQQKGLIGSKLCFDGAMPLVEAELRQRKIRLLLDTGAESTELYPLFAKEFASVLSESGQKDTAQVNGLDGTAEVESINLPELRLKLGGLDAVLHSTPVLLKQTTPDTQQFQHGNLGLDLLSQARKVTLDFKTMRLKLD